MNINILEILGLIFNTGGTLIIALSVKENPGKANQMVEGKKIYLASIYLNTFRWGIFTLLVGFLLQMLGMLF